MREAEQAFSDFYAECAKKWSESYTFWEEMSTAEIKHVGFMRRMAEIITERPEKFSANRPFNEAATRTVISWAKSNLAKVASGELSQEKALGVSLDFENSILEGRYNEIVKSNDIEYGNLVEEVVSDTRQHKAMLTGKLKQF